MTSAELRLLDCNTRIGRVGIPPPTHFETAGELEDELARHNVVGALTFHATAQEQSPARGNQQLREALAGHDRLHPCFVLLPPGTGELDEGDDLPGWLRGEGVRAVRLFPRLHNYTLGDWCAGRLLEALAEVEAVVLIEIGQTSWDELASVTRAYPRLHVILLEPFYRVDRYLHNLWERVDNLHVETATYQTHRGIETVCERFGPERLVFGSGLPVRDVGGAITPLLYADISDEAKRLIAGDTLRGLLKEAAPA